MGCERADRVGADTLIGYLATACAGFPNAPNCSKVTRERPRGLARNLDRARLMPSPQMRHIVVDASSGQLWFCETGRQIGTMRVVGGARAVPWVASKSCFRMMKASTSMTRPTATCCGAPTGI
jgi:hypothetical protein